jgi:hypothetical protein
MARRKALADPVKASGSPLLASAFRIKSSTAASAPDQRRRPRVNNAAAIRHARFRLEPVKHALSSKRD